MGVNLSLLKEGRPIAVDDADRLTALGEWFAAEYQGLVRFATAVCGDVHMAEDLVQEAFVRVHLANARIEPEFHAYARRAIVNLARSRWRRRNAEQRAFSRIDQPDETLHEQERDDQIWRALRVLSPRQRAVIALRYFEDLSERDIASTLAISPGNVKKHASRGIERMRALLQEDPA